MPLVSASHTDGIYVLQNALHFGIFMFLENEALVGL